MSKNVKRILWASFTILPFCLGFIGYLNVYDFHLSWAAYSAVRLYTANIDSYELNLWIDIARWLALLVLASNLLLVIRTASNAIINRFKCLSQKSCAVYGDSPYTKHLIKNLGWYGIAASGKVINRAKEHVLFFDTDEENIAFLIKNPVLLSDLNVKIKLDKVVSHCVYGKNVTAFSIADNCARLYWKQNPVTKNEKIAIIGFDALGQEMLVHGLMLNLFSAEQQIEYHIWGDSECFLGLHTEISKIDIDKLIFHDEKWQAGILKEKKFDRIIICSDVAENLINLSIALSYVPSEKLYVFVETEESIKCFEKEKTGIIPFGAVEQLATRDVILMESLLENAKMLHEKYRAKYPQLGLWDDLSGFHKRSNISAADYGEMIRGLKTKPSIEELTELEHIRWNRFHYLNNWTYDPVRDNDNKKHNALVPFSELSDENKQKDRTNVEYYLSDGWSN